MIEQDTVKLLRECDAGIKMGVESINDVMGYIKSEDMRNDLHQCQKKHESLSREIQDALHRFGDEGKDPNPMAEKMSWLKTNMKLMMNESDQTIADLMTDGCNMGVKSLNRYLNQYKAADETAKDVTKKLIQQEEMLTHQMARYL